MHTPDWYRAKTYPSWRASKLEHAATPVEQLIVELPTDLSRFSPERMALLNLIEQHNFAFFRSPEILGKSSLAKIAADLGMLHLDQNLCADDDAVSSIQVMDLDIRGGYIPYSNKPLNWHTDGYYNALEEHVRSFLLYCVRSADEGGENRLLDHEIAYIQLRDQNPAYIDALMADDAMSIPANVQDGVEVRPTQRGPVFYIDPQTQHLQMRYTARTRSIAWKSDSMTQSAVAALRELLDDSNPYIKRYRMGPGEGLVSNNVIHSRSAFNNGDIPQRVRLLYRIRSYDRINTDSAE